MVKKCTVEFSRDNLEDNPIQEDQSPLSYKRPLQGSCSIIVDRRAQGVTLLQGSASWVPKLLGPDQKWIQHNLSRENDNLGFSGNL